MYLELHLGLGFIYVVGA